MSPEDTRVMCAFIKNLCKKLKLKSNVMCSALVFFHRFHAQHVAGSVGSTVQYDDYDLATSCVFLACKVEENIIKLERILDASHELRTNETKHLSEDAERMWKTRERTLICERVLLDTISFNVAVEHSHFHANRFSLQLADGDKNEARVFHQIASNILNDSLSTNLCLQHSPALFGAAAVRLAGRFLKDQSPAQKACVARMEAMESTGKIFGFDSEELVKVEDELISTYEFGGGPFGSEPEKKLKPTIDDDNGHETES
jgi:hypothetical protein